MKSICLISHGSKSAKTKEEVLILVEKLKSQTGIENIQIGFLELESPSIPEGIEACINEGASEVLVLLNFLNSGRHVDKDIPEIVEGVKAKYPEINISISSPVGQHEQIVSVFADLIQSH